MKILAYKDFEAPSKQKLKELNMIKKISIILAISFVLVSTTGYAQEMTADTILKRMNELAEESQNTKDMNRFKEIAKEMGKLWEAYTQAIQRSGKMPPQSGFSPPRNRPMNHERTLTNSAPRIAQPQPSTANPGTTRATRAKAAPLTTR